MFLVQFALPNPSYLPSVFAQHADNKFVALHIVSELFLPKLQTSLWRVSEFAPSVTVPKAAVHEHRDLFLREDKIWFAEHRNVSTPTRDSMTSKHGNHLDLRGAISTTANTRH